MRNKINPFCGVLFMLCFLCLEDVKAQNSGEDKVTAAKGSYELEQVVSINSVEEAPIYPGCKSTNRRESRTCFNRNVHELLVKHFNVDLPRKIKLEKGKNRSLIYFTINTLGKVDNIRVIANHPKLKAELERIILLLPTIKPGKQKGENVNVRYGLPFTIKVE